jgi:hypothetical protein
MPRSTARNSPEMLGRPIDLQADEGLISLLPDQPPRRRSALAARLGLVITRKPARMTAGDVTVTGAAGHLSAQDRSRRAQEVIFDINPNATRGLSACYRSAARRPTWTTRRF